MDTVNTLLYMIEKEGKNERMQMKRKENQYNRRPLLFKCIMGILVRSYLS